MQSIAYSVSKSVPFVMLQDDIFLPFNLKNNKISSVFEKLVVIAERALIYGLHKKTNATEKYLSSVGTDFFGVKLLLIFIRDV